MKSKPWTDEEVNLLIKNWKKSTREDLEKIFPHRTFDAVRYKAKVLGIENRKTRNSNSADWMADVLERTAEGKTLDKKQTDRLAALLEANGVEISRTTNDTAAKKPVRQVGIKSWDGPTYSFGLISCSHLGSKYQQLTALNDFYDELERREIPICLHAGDLVDGASSFHKGFEYGLFAHGADEQRDYAIEVYPHRAGIETHIISGNHDLSFKKESGFNVVKAVCAHRKDMTFCGDWWADMQLPGEFKVRLRHGRGGGSYAKSYNIQRIISSLNLHDDPPNLYAVGHYHTAIWLPNQQGVSAFLISAFQGMTDFAKSLVNVHSSVVGGWIITYQIDEGRALPASVKAEFIEYPEVYKDF